MQCSLCNYLLFELYSTRRKFDVYKIVYVGRTKHKLCFSLRLFIDLNFTMCFFFVLFTFQRQSLNRFFTRRPDFVRCMSYFVSLITPLFRFSAFLVNFSPMPLFSEEATSVFPPAARDWVKRHAVDLVSYRGQT